MAIEYFREPVKRIKNDGVSQGGGSRLQQYMAADTSGAMDRPPESHLQDMQQRPISEMSTQVEGGRYIPTFSEPEHWEGGGFTEHAETAKQTGLHPEYLNRLDTEGRSYHPTDSRRQLSMQLEYARSTPSERRWQQDNFFGPGVDPGVDPKNPALSPSTLFIQTPKKVTVDRLFSDPAMPAGTALSLAAMAMNDHHVEQLTPSEDLSAHSSKLVQHAKKLGVIADNPYNKDAEQKNDIEKQSHTVDAYRGWTEDTYGEEGRGIGATLHRASASDVFAAQQKVRKIVRGRSSKTSPKISSQFDVPLPGMEGFV